MSNDAIIIIITILSLLVAIIIPLYVSRANKKEDFIKSLKENINKLKKFILTLEDKEYSQKDKIIIIETIQDYLFYMGYEKEKNKYLNPYQSKRLFNLQEELEDLTSNILIQCDTDVCKMQIKENLNIFLKDLGS
ncbi:hypothetical protein ACN9JU_01590 [Aliarcobacter butzleri]|uniref:hypothetical protein n=1 Tax=Aliarcobacter butzleri TaxID=28197 RepID=UPI003B20C199